MMSIERVRASRARTKGNRLEYQVQALTEKVEKNSHLSEEQSIRDDARSNGMRVLLGTDCKDAPGRKIIHGQDNCSIS